ncbi:flagellar basal body protein [Microbacterium sp. zg.Y625]|uniref:flagellar basal body rod protein FlgB n=1 Tax=Microbacterium jiangjiandongii TaxID=3049071 RepID=UPI00214D0FA3|nr:MULTISPECIES: flagellar basal body protein [unclassified Microbacterium]MCR2793231.1 flagellar basal body protein [Microbacterium sp. zg.Y625]MCR2815592.1 flagellar basal body protein [Microbacterium sp. zg.Y843]WIM25390.1 flagellar basal body protein [Microbacterium sp. zg-Y625]
MFDSVTTTALTSALDGLSQRQRAIADNIANVNTSGYRAKVVAFEDALAASVARGDGDVAPAVTESRAATRLNGNNVNLDTETLTNIETVLRYQFASQAVGGTFSSVQTALRTS